MRAAGAFLAAVLMCGCTATPLDVSSSTTSTATFSTTSAATDVEFESIDASAGLFEGDKQVAWSSLDLTVPETSTTFFAERAAVDGMLLSGDRFRTSEKYWLSLGWHEWGEQCVYRTPVYAECSASFTTALHGPAGLEFSVWRQVWFDDAGLITAISRYPSINDIELFDEAFDVWLTEAHPDIAGTQYRWTDSDRDSDAVSQAISVLGEFLEQSDEFPLTDHIEVADPQLSDEVQGVEVYNANPYQVELVKWALSRFEQAGLPPPPVTEIFFPPTVACEEGASGRAYHNGTSGSIDVCGEASVFSDYGLPITEKRAILHELGHIWVIGHTDSEARTTLMESRGLSDWTGTAWQDNGFEHSAEIIMWGLIDAPIIPRIDKRTTPELTDAYTILTGKEPPATNQTSDP